MTSLKRAAAGRAQIGRLYIQHERGDFRRQLAERERMHGITAVGAKRVVRRDVAPIERVRVLPRSAA
jgi:hypothetical protein